LAVATQLYRDFYTTMMMMVKKEDGGQGETSTAVAPVAAVAAIGAAWSRELEEEKQKQSRRKLMDDLAKYDAEQKVQALRLPRGFEAHSIWARMYAPNERLGFHQDPPYCQHALLISLGHAVEFSYARGCPKGVTPPAINCHPTAADKIPEDPAEEGRVHTVRLDSGDAIMFNGTILFHAVTNVHGPETRPAWWDDARYVRLGLQMRAIW
jgi:hypothetical protein